MSLLRAETRTETGWQRFDRVAGLVAFLLILALVALTLQRAGFLNKWLGINASDQTATIAMAESASEQMGEKVSEPLAPADQAESKSSEDSASGDASSAASSKPDLSADESSPAKAGESASESATAQSPASPAAANAVDDKSLASQDPARQARFERIPINIKKPISVGGSGTEVTSTATDTANAQPPANAPKPAPESADAKPANSAENSPASITVNPILELRSSGGKLIISGIVRDEDVRAEILRTALKTYGMRNLTEKLKVNSAVAPFEWAGGANDLMVLIGGADSETAIRIDGDEVTLTGEVAALEDKQARALAAQQFFGTSARVSNRLRVNAAPASTVMVARPEIREADKPVASLTEPNASAQAPSLPSADNEAAQPSPADEKSTDAAVTEARQSTENSAAAPAAVPGSSAATTEVNTDANSETASDKPKSSSEGASNAEQDKSDNLIADVRAAPEKFALRDCAKIATGIRIPFGSGSSKLTAEGREVLDDVQRCLSRRRYIVGGHTDSQGSGLNNLILSQARAQSAVDYLVSKGVPASLLSAKGYGESRPISTNRTEQGRALNRRIDFRFDR